ncbi:MAG: hypothetical protein WA705_02195 [Candidatus Ozemobacteraceae bacterium]
MREQLSGMGYEISKHETAIIPIFIRTLVSVSWRLLPQKLSILG